MKPSEQMALNLETPFENLDGAMLRAGLDVEFRDAILVVADDQSEGLGAETLASIRNCLSQFDVIGEVSLSVGKARTPTNKRVFGVRGRGIEKCRDELKKLFFSRYLSSASVAPFCLSDFVLFFPPVTKPTTGLIERTFVHGEGRFYRFLFSPEKVPTHRTQLHRFLSSTPNDCPNHLFFDGPKASKGEWQLGAQFSKIDGSDLPELVRRSFEKKLMKRAHDNIERFLILNDASTFACEVPVWLQPSDFPDFEKRFGTGSCITGHIDILRLEANGKIGVWDYKPNASKEKKAADQVMFYAMMLSKRADVPLDDICGGYFDDSDVFVVRT